jgi:hypothetical protein
MSDGEKKGSGKEKRVVVQVETNKDAEIEIEDLELLYEIKKEACTAAEKKDAERIIKNKEASSYKKLKNILSEK